MAGTVEIYLDCTELIDLLQWMRRQLTPEKFDTLMRRTLNEVGKRGKKIIRSNIQAEYYAPSAFVNRAIRSGQIEGGGGSICLRIPVIGAQGNVGSTFSAVGGFYGGPPPPYRIQSNIVKGNVSVLPSRMTHQGGQPPFRNTGERTTRKNSSIKLKKPVVTQKGALNGLVFTRKSKARLPIVKVSALAVPQMPVNRARPGTEAELSELGIKRAMHNFSRIFE